MNFGGRTISSSWRISRITSTLPPTRRYFESAARRSRLSAVWRSSNSCRTTTAYPPVPTAFALTMLATTSNGDAYTFRELSRMLREAGFRSIDRPDTGDLPQCVVTASP